MNFKKRKTLAVSPSMLETLDTVKTAVFGQARMTLEDVSNCSTPIMETPKKGFKRKCSAISSNSEKFSFDVKKSVSSFSNSYADSQSDEIKVVNCDDDSLPNSINTCQNVPSTSLCQSKHQDHIATELLPVKKQKMKEEAAVLDENEQTPKMISMVKAAPPTEEEIRKRREKQQAYLSSFMQIGLKYSEYLQKKMENGQPSSSTGQTSESTTNFCERQDIMEKLHYFNGSLRDYQRVGVTWLTILFENSINGILADEMGLGKTIQIIALFCHLYERKVKGPFLIVCPLSTLPNWESEFERFAPKLPVVRFHGNPEEKRKQMRRITKYYDFEDQKVRPIVLCTYQTPLNVPTFLQQFRWQYLVVDEGQRIKNANSKLAKELRNLQSVNKILLTGTPLQNDLTELWALFNFLMPDLFQDNEGFSSLIQLEDMQDTDQLLQNEAENKIVSTVHKVLAPFMLRREKKFVLKDLVPKKEVIVDCPLTELQKYLYTAILKQEVWKLLMKPPFEQIEKKRNKRRTRTQNVNYCEEEYLSNEDYEFVHVNNTLMPMMMDKTTKCTPEHVPVPCPKVTYRVNLKMTNRMIMLRKVVNHPFLLWTPLDPKNESHMLINEDLVEYSGKLKVLDAMLLRLKKNGDKVLVFSTSVMFMELIEDLLILRRYNYSRLDGCRDFENRKENIYEFSNNPECFIFLISTRAGGLGLNLVAANTVIFMDRDWNPMADVQAQDRCHRIGQTKPVMVYSLITKGTIDEIVVARGDAKKLLEKIVIKEGKFQNIHKKFSDDELKELEELLHKEADTTKIRANGTFYTKKELDKLMDRSELYAEMQQRKQ